jgi:hypothetical protein
MRIEAPNDIEASRRVRNGSQALANPWIVERRNQRVLCVHETQRWLAVPRLLLLLVLTRCPGLARVHSSKGLCHDNCNQLAQSRAPSARSRRHRAALLAQRRRFVSVDSQRRALARPPRDRHAGMVAAGDRPRNSRAANMGAPLEDCRDRLQAPCGRARVCARSPGSPAPRRSRAPRHRHYSSRRSAPGQQTVLAWLRCEKGRARRSDALEPIDFVQARRDRLKIPIVYRDWHDKRHTRDSGVGIWIGMQSSSN